LSNRLAVTFSLAFLLVAASACSSRNNTAKRGASEPTQSIAPSATSLPVNDSADCFDFALTNEIGTSLSAVYISPSDSPRWEENLLAGDKLEDGGTVNIRFNREVRTPLWDLRIEFGVCYAEWKSLSLRDITRIILRLNLEGQTVMVAEVE
jgi:hypothetical protein